MPVSARGQWHEEGDAGRATALLDPWFATGRELTGKLEPLFDQLMDSYLALGRERQRQRLLTEVISRGETEQARERARFWIARLERARDPELADFIALMRHLS
ncbi:hypothetical protein V4890_24500 [Ralstonia solanacearum species complex bacterium KE056]|uniref:hypothetical protein n=1 Tax=Ralstonia solanacearum species complex bacterium KE056 TaxID=3119585 RepID=UPI002FC307F3|nr:hypothetical protein [Burkholderiales bacterium]